MRIYSISPTFVISRQTDATDDGAAILVWRFWLIGRLLPLFHRYPVMREANLLQSSLSFLFFFVIDSFVIETSKGLYRRLVLWKRCRMESFVLHLIAPLSGGCCSPAVCHQCFETPRAHKRDGHVFWDRFSSIPAPNARPPPPPSQSWNEGAAHTSAHTCWWCGITQLYIVSEDVLYYYDLMKCCLCVDGPWRHIAGSIWSG